VRYMLERAAFTAKMCLAKRATGKLRAMSNSKHN